MNTLPLNLGVLHVKRMNILPLSLGVGVVDKYSYGLLSEDFLLDFEKKKIILFQCYTCTSYKTNFLTEF